jgi:bifunctional non-homologous end joining protein LigD
LGLEGIISKRKDLPYRPGRGHHWFKAKCMLSQEFVILGYVPSTAASGAVGALALGYYLDGKLAYAGRVGTGWSADLAKSLRKELDKIKAGKPALLKPLPAGAEKGVVWAEPRLVCGWNSRDWTRDGLIRNSSFKGLREDKPAQDIGRRRHRSDRRQKPMPWQKASSSPTPSDIVGRPGVTKQGLADFYTDIAD